MKAYAIQIAVAVACMLICVAAAVLLPPLWEGLSGRDFRAQATLMAVLLFLTSALLRGGLRWPPLGLVLALLVFESAMLLTVGYFSGYAGAQLFSRFNLAWLAYMNLFTGLPWLAGLGLGSIAGTVRR